MADVSALILAAGISSRMGQSKQLLDLGGVPLLERVITLVLPFSFAKIVVVVGRQTDCIEEKMSLKDERLQWIENTAYGGQSSSFKKGIDAVQTSSVMIFLGDQPFVAKETIQTVFDFGTDKQVESDKPFVMRTMFQKIPGHPVFLGHIDGIDFTGLAGDEGAKPVIRRLAERYNLDTNDPGTIFDIDTPEDYQKAKHIYEQQSFCDA